MPYRKLQLGAALLGASMLLAGCGGAARYGTPRHYAWDTSVSAACRKNPAYCAHLTGKEGVVPLSRPAQAAVSAGAAGRAAELVLDATTQARITKAMEECANEAHSQVLFRKRGGKNPSAEECRQQVGVDSQGRPVTLAMQLGNEMHRAALDCARERLGQLRPGGFSLEQRYRYDNGTTTLVSPEEVQRLLRQGGEGLRGTFVPDVVVHSGHPLRAQAVYDFKFPCSAQSNMPSWRKYPEGHPFAELNQGQLYKRALQGKIWRVSPLWGTSP